MPQSTQVLVIDDDHAVRVLFRDLLTSAGEFRLHEAPDGRSGLARAVELRPDLILLDLNMPDMSGLEVCQVLRTDERTREIPILVLSSVQDSEVMVSVLDAGADDFLRKPFSALEFRAKVRTIARLNRFRALAAERDRFRWLLDHSDEPLVVTDAIGGLIHANARAREIFALDDQTGTDVPTAIGRHFRVDPPDTWTAWRERRLRPDATMVLYQPETPQVAARWYDVRIHSIKAAAGQILLKFTDRSGSVRRELEIFTFQHLISHKIRTPLNGICPILSVLCASEENIPDEGTRDLLRVTMESAERLESSLLGILHYHDALFSRKRWHNPATHRPLDALLATSAEAAGLRGRVPLSTRPHGVAHAEMMQVALTELLENYVKFSDAPRTGVTVSFTETDEGWALQFFAPGPGLPPDVAAQLGRAYSQLECSFSGEVPGMGLGLATVRLLLRSIGGDLVFAPGATNPGLISTILLPAAAVSAAPEHALQPVAS